MHRVLLVSEAPCVLVLKRALRTQLDLMRPDLSIEVIKKQADQKDCHDRHSKDQQYIF